MMKEMVCVGERLFKRMMRHTRLLPLLLYIKVSIKRRSHLLSCTNTYTNRDRTCCIFINIKLQTQKYILF